MATDNPKNDRVPVATETRTEILKPLLRGGETYDSLLRKMAEQYDLEKASH